MVGVLPVFFNIPSDTTRCDVARTWLNLLLQELFVEVHFEQLILDMGRKC